MGPFFSNIGGGKIDHNPEPGPFKTIVGYRRFNPLLTLPDGMIRQSNNEKPNTLGDVNFNGDQDCPDPLNRTAESFDEHALKMIPYGLWVQDQYYRCLLFSCSGPVPSNRFKKSLSF